MIIVTFIIMIIINIIIGMTISISIEHFPTLNMVLVY